MKKIIISLSILLLVFVLASCTGSIKTDQFNDRLVYEDEVTGIELELLQAKIKENLKSFSEISSTVKHFANYGSIDEETEIGIEYKAYANEYISAKTSTKEKSLHNGTGTEKKSSSVLNIWNNESAKRIIEYIENDDGTSTYSTTSYTDETKASKIQKMYSDVADSILLNMLSISSLEAYKDGNGGYVLVKSSKNEVRNAVEWGGETKEHYQLNNTQTIVQINKDYQITSITMFSDKNTNRDPQTGEWYSKTKQIQYDSTVIKIEYDERDENKSAVKDLNEKFNSPFIDSLSVGVKYLTDLEDETTQQYYNGNKSSIKTLTQSQENVLTSFTISSDFKAFTLDVLLSVFKVNDEGSYEKVMISKKIDFSDTADENDNYEVVTIGENKYIKYTGTDPNPKFIIEFDVELKGDEVVFSNIDINYFEDE